MALQSLYLIIYLRHKLELENIQKSWEQRLKEEKEANKHRIEEINKEESQKQNTPYIWNLNEDLYLCNKIIHFLEDGLVMSNNVNYINDMVWYTCPGMKIAILLLLYKTKTNT